MRLEREAQMIDPNTVISTISETKLPGQVQEWLISQSAYLAKLIDVYVENPDTFGLHPDLRVNPMLILKTVLYSAETLYGYQKAYNEALNQIANANDITFSNLEDVPELLQEVSLEREEPRVKKHLEEGGNVAVGLMGSGASGKGTIGKRTGMERAVNVTTRFKRPGEEHGKDYNYIREMEPLVADTLDIDTGVANGVNYFDKYGPYVTTVHRVGRARHGTPVSEFTKHFNEGQRAIFFEHGPVQVMEAGEKLPELVPNTLVMPVCVLPPKSGFYHFHFALQ